MNSVFLSAFESECCFFWEYIFLNIRTVPSPLIWIRLTKTFKCNLSLFKKVFESDFVFDWKWLSSVVMIAVNFYQFCYFTKMMQIQCSRIDLASNVVIKLVVIHRSFWRPKCGLKWTSTLFCTVEISCFFLIKF